jgi:hypothetical protein
MAKRSIELREEARTKHNLVGDVLKLAGADRDFSKREVLDKLTATDSADAVKKWRAANADAHRLFNEAVDEELKEDIQQHGDRDEALRNPKPERPEAPLAVSRQRQDARAHARRGRGIPQVARPRARTAARSAWRSPSAPGSTCRGRRRWSRRPQASRRGRRASPMSCPSRCGRSRSSI